MQTVLLSAAAAILLGYLAGFVNHKAGIWTYYRETNNVLHLPVYWLKSQGYRAFVYCIAIMLTLASLFFSTHWALSGAILLWVIGSWQSGYQRAYQQAIDSMARHVMEKENIGLAAAQLRAKEIIDTFRSIR